MLETFGRINWAKAFLWSLVVLQTGASIAYMCQRNLKMGVYWLLAALIALNFLR